ncbi:hypothetical protein MTO96_024004 [Rhipicephalus appendiculatus]
MAVRETRLSAGKHNIVIRPPARADLLRLSKLLFCRVAGFPTPAIIGTRDGSNRCAALPGTRAQKAAEAITLLPVFITKPPRHLFAATLAGVGSLAAGAAPGAAGSPSTLPLAADDRGKLLAVAGMPFYEIGRQTASAGPELIWKIYDAQRKSDKREASVFVFEKRVAEKLHKPKRKETVTEILPLQRQAVGSLQAPQIAHHLPPY